MNNNDKKKNDNNIEIEIDDALEIKDNQTEEEIQTREIMTKRKIRSKQEKRALKLLNEMKGAKDFPVSPEEIAEIRPILGKEQLAAFLVGTCHPEMSYDKIAGLVGCDTKTLWAWRQDAAFRAEVKRYGEEHIERNWLPVVRAQTREALKGNTFAATFLARVLGKAATKVDITAYTPETKRLSEMTDEELEIHIAELKAAREAKGG